jgi:tetratricopeptide (TPR) repeat protein
MDYFTQRHKGHRKDIPDSIPLVQLSVFVGNIPIRFFKYVIFADDTLLTLSAVKRILFYILFFPSSIFLGLNSSAQTKQDAKKWLQQLEQPYNDSMAVTEIVWVQWRNKKGDYCIRAVQLLEEEAGSNPGKPMIVKLELLKAFAAYASNSPYEQLSFEDWYNKALQGASELGDEYLIQACCYNMGMHYLQSNNYEAGLFYWIKAIELAEKLGATRKRINGAKAMASSYLHITHNYEAGISYCKDILQYPQPELDTNNLMAVYNNLGLCYRDIGNYDSALYNFSKAAELAEKINLGVWVGITRGNMGDVLNLKHQPEQAVVLWRQDVDSCLKYGELDNAGLSMAFISEYLFNKGEREQGIALMERAQQLTGGRPRDLLVIRRIKASFFRQLGQYDSAIIFLDNYHRLNDSLNSVITRSNYRQLKLRLDFENNANQYKLIRKEKEVETTRRNFLLAALAIALLAAWLLLNRQRLKYKLAVQQKRIAENEAVSAREQLQLFTQTLLEKNVQIEQLNRQLHHIQQQSEDELIHQTILTDEDWTRFRQLFEKAHPGFFEQLKKAAPDITTAEIRLAALLKLNLDNKQMASMQGISLSSLRGNKTRLKHRLNIVQENGLEEFIRNL